MKCCTTDCRVRSCQEDAVHWLDCPWCWLAGTCYILLLLLLLDLLDLLGLLGLLLALTGLACWVELTGHSQQVDLQRHLARHSLGAADLHLLPLR